MFKSFFALFAVAVMLLSGCSKPKLLTDIEVDTSSPLISDDRTTQVTGGVLSELIDSMRLVPLDESCLVGNIRHIRHANGHLYVQTEDELLLFDDNGRFVKTVAVKGQGPEEVVDFNDFDVDSTGLVILDPTKFLFFDTKGNPKKSIHNDYGFGRIRLIPGGKGWVMKAVEPTENNHTLIAFNNQGDTVFTAFEPYEFEVPRVQDLFHLNDTIFLNPLCALGGNELIALDITKGNGRVIPVSVTGDPLSAKDFIVTSNAYKGKVNSPQLCFSGFADNNSQLYFSACKTGKHYTYIYDKESGRVLKLFEDEIENDMIPKTKENNIFGFVFRTSSDDDYFVSWISDPKTIYEQSATLNPRFKAEYAKLADIDDESNPVVVFLKFKSPAEFANKTE